jgi:hypothetical protein
MKIKNLALAAVASAFALTGAASAHVWNIGWKSTGGGLTFYGTSWHGGTGILGAGSVDDFSSRPAGFVLGGMNLTFDIGSATDLPDCNGPGGLSAGSCSGPWNALGLAGTLHGTSYPSNTYGKYAFATLLAGDLSTYGIGQGNNLVTLGTFSDNVHWANVAFASATVPINIVVKPPSNNPSAVPLPAGFPLMLAGLGAFAALRSRRKKAA